MICGIDLKKLFLKIFPTIPLGVPRAPPRKNEEVIRGGGLGRKRRRKNRNWTYYYYGMAERKADRGSEGLGRIG